MNLDLLYLQNGKELPFCVRRLKWPPRAYFQVRYLVPRIDGGTDYYGEYHNGYHVSKPQRQWEPSKEDWELVSFK